jgi:arginine exporter protein ArgO
VQYAALVFGIVFLAVGLLGFVPGVTMSLEDLRFAGHESRAMLLGIFQVSILHNMVHLFFGVVGIWLATHPRTSRAYLIWGGLVYALLWLYGLAIDLSGPANVVPVNQADNWLHLVLAVAMIALGVLLSRRRSTVPGTVE